VFGVTIAKALHRPSIANDSSRQRYSKSQPLVTVKMGNKDPFPPSDLVESSKNGNFLLFTAFFWQFLSFENYFYPFEKNKRKREEVFPL